MGNGISKNEINPHCGQVFGGICTFFFLKKLSLYLWQYEEMIHFLAILKKNIFPNFFGLNSYFRANFVYMIFNTTKTFGHHSFRTYPKNPSVPPTPKDICTMLNMISHRFISANEVLAFAATVDWKSKDNFFLIGIHSMEG